jgi:uncharacterized protein YgiM (DUF1202 family)
MVAMKNLILLLTITPPKCSLMLVIPLLLITSCAQVSNSPQSASRAYQATAQSVKTEPPPPTSGATSSAEVAPAKRMETVISERLAVRSEPKKNSEAVAELRKGESVEVKEQGSNGWVRVATREGKEGWVYGGSLTGFPEPTKPKKAPSPLKSSPRSTSGSSQTEKAGASKTHVSDSLDSETTSGKKATKAPKPDDSVVDLPAMTKPVVDDAKVTGQKP